MKPKLSNGTLSFKQDGITGGRNDIKNGDGFCCVSFEPNLRYKEILIAITDNITSQDGHWSHLSLNLNAAKTLRDWLSAEIAKIEEKGK